VGCVSSTGATIAQTGEVNCRNNGGTVNNPWGIPINHWGMPMKMRDSTGNPLQVQLGSSTPDFKVGFAQNLTFKRLTVHALIDGTYGHRVYNEQVQWSMGDFMVRREDQDGKSVEEAKPLGYYWRATLPDNGSGVGGMYDALTRNNFSVMPASFTKLRELSVGYSIGSIRGVGDWTASVVGRNLFLITDFYGWDPETGGGGGTINNAAVGGIQGTGTYPQMRTFTFSLGTRF
jgi:hypothetical protein